MRRVDHEKWRNWSESHSLDKVVWQAPAIFFFRGRILKNCPETRRGTSQASCFIKGGGIGRHTAAERARIRQGAVRDHLWGVFDTCRAIFGVSPIRAHSVNFVNAIGGRLLHLTMGRKAFVALASKIRQYGWLDVGGNVSSPKHNNSPNSYDLVPNSVQLDQIVLRLEALLTRIRPTTSTGACVEQCSTGPTIAIRSPRGIWTTRYSSTTCSSAAILPSSALVIVLHVAIPRTGGR